MKRDELDKELERWTSESEVMITNLFELTELMSYQLLSSSVDSIKGYNSEKIVSAINSLETLLEQSALIKDVIDRASKMRDSLPILGTTKAIAAIVELLEGNSIKLKTKEVPLEQRGLLSGSEEERTISPKALKELMVSRFATCRSSLMELERAIEKSGPQLEELGQQIRRVVNRRAKYKGNSIPLKQLVNAFCQLEQDVNLNPYAMANTNFTPLISKIENEIKTFERAHRALEDKVKLARQNLADLKAERIRCLRHYAKYKDQMVAAENLKEPPKTKALETLLREIETILVKKDWEILGKKINFWFSMFNERMAGTKSTIEYNQEITETRKKLLQRWESLQRSLKMAREYGILGQPRVKKLVDNVKQIIKDFIKGKVLISEAEKYVVMLEIRIGEQLAKRGLK